VEGEEEEEGQEDMKILLLDSQRPGTTIHLFYHKLRCALQLIKYLFNSSVFSLLLFSMLHCQ
jgi:hypothetical protein